MQKTILYTTILLFSLFFSGCIREDNGLCLSEDGNVLLRLSYTDKSGGDLLKETLHSVEMVLFREDYRYYDRLTITPEDITGEGTIRFDLPSGLYYIVFWGNLQNKTRLREIHAFTTINDAGVHHTGTDTGDPVYYAPCRSAAGLQGYDMYSLEVPTRGIVEREFEFMTAYRTINVFIEEATTKATTLPTISLDNLHNGYNFHLVPQSTTASFTQQARETTTPEGIMPGASFRVSHFDLENPISIRLEGTGSDAALSQIAFSQFLREYGYTPVLGDGAVINVVITLSEGGGLISMRIARWDPEEVKPAY